MLRTKYFEAGEKMYNDPDPGKLENTFLVGRSKEITEFLNELSERNTKKIINIYGTAGVGKSYLLTELKQIAKSKSSYTLFIDGERISMNPHSFCMQLWRDLHPEENATNFEENSLFNYCLEDFNKLADKQDVVLFLDAYERMETLDEWLREYFLKQLDPRILVIIAGRIPLSKPWFLSPTWRQSIVRISLSELTFDAVEQYAKYNGITDSTSILRLWNYSKGHPLTLSLITFFLQEHERLDLGWQFNDQDTLPYIVEQWLKEVPGNRLRPLIEAASVLRDFNQESLSFVIGDEITTSDFLLLTRFSFVSKTNRSWILHTLMRESIQQELLHRAPSHFEQLRERAMLYYYNRLEESSSISANSYEAYEMMYYIENSLIRAFMSRFDHAPLCYEPVGIDSLDELNQYVKNRHLQAKDTRVELYDLHANQKFEYYWTKEQSCFTLQWLDFEELFELGYDVIRVLRDSSASIIGLAVVIPINRKTLPYLKNNPRGGTYFSNLSQKEIDQLAVPENDRAGWFIETIDTENFSDPSQQTAIGYFLFSFVLSGELVVESPAPLPYFTDTHHGLGFEIAPNCTHTNYDGITESPTFVVQMNKEKLLSLIEKVMLKKTIVQKQLKAPTIDDQEKIFDLDTCPIMNRTDLTVREKEVAKLLEEGLTNSEMAKRLFLSEATIKKHIKSMLQKLDASNRTQLLKKLLGL